MTAKHLRMEVFECWGDHPTLREVEWFPETDSAIAFDEWVVSVQITEDPSRRNSRQFIDLAHQCEAGKDLQGQEIWVGDFDESFLAI